MRCSRCGYDRPLFGGHDCAIRSDEKQRKENYAKIVSARLEETAAPKTERQMKYSTIYCYSCGIYHTGPECD